MALGNTYDARNFLAAFGEVNLTGFAPDTFITVAFNSDLSTMQIGADGVHNTRTISRDRSATITIRLQQHAPANDQLSSIYQEDVLAGLGVRPFAGRDLTTGATFAAASCVIKRPPDAEYAAESGVFEWVLETDDLVATYGDPATRNL